MAPVLIQEVENDVPPTSLQLTPVESTLTRLLLDVASYVDKAPSPGGVDGQVTLPNELVNEKIILRYTGGWVRDKVLGVQSHDIDVAINKMTGYQFGLKMKEYLELPGNPEKYGLDGVATTDKQSQKAGSTNKSKTVGGLHKIEANPEKSKHLETVTTKILGLDIDLVNLRKETYTEDSRNPQMEFGTPEEDALRRDATVNAMFYNLNTQVIEDFTTQGHDDMQARIIRTPLEPYQTFKDDPLRVLRLIRFASRLDYIIDPAALDAMKNADIKDALRRKISRERVGVELEKMLRGPDPRYALSLIDKLGLYYTIFSDPTAENGGVCTPDTQKWEQVIEQLYEITEGQDSLRNILVNGDEESYIAWQLCAVIPYRDAPQPEPVKDGGKVPPPAVTQIAREGIKATNKVCDVITAAVRNQQEISQMVAKLHEQSTRPNKHVEAENAGARDVLGMAIRRWGSSWRSQVMYALLVDLADNLESVQLYRRRYNNFVEHLQTLGILDVCGHKPLLDGKALAKALHTPPGPWMKEALDVVMAWQLRNPGNANAEAAVEAVKNHQKHGELTSSLISHFLRLTIRPLFAKTQPQSVTAQGRKVTTTVLPKKYSSLDEDDETTKPWKSKDSPALNLLEWTMQSMDESTLEHDWPMVIPPLLTIMDDHEVRYKTKGAQLIKLLLESTSPALLARTGLGEVIEEALMPCLTYLPTITAEKESVDLLSATYPALITLSRVRYPAAQPSSSRLVPANLDRERVKFLDSLVRKGILYAYSHCSDRPAIIEVLLSGLADIEQELGIDSVKHLKHVLPMLTEVMSLEQGPARPSMLLAGTKAMQSVILNGWPRMVVYRGEVLKAVTLCWLRVAGDKVQELDRLKKALTETVEMFRAAVGKECDFDHECSTLVAADQRLREVLDVR